MFEDDIDLKRKWESLTKCMEIIAKSLDREGSDDSIAILSLILLAYMGAEEHGRTKREFIDFVEKVIDIWNAMKKKSN